MIVPAIQASPYVRLQRECIAPRDGKILVRVGQVLKIGDPIVEFTERPRIALLDLAQGLRIPAENIQDALHCDRGDYVESGDLLAGPVGITRRVLRAPFKAKIVQIRYNKIMLVNDSQLQILNTLYPGEVVRLIEDRGVVIETCGALIQGIWGNGKSDSAILNAVKPVSDSPDQALVTENQETHVIVYRRTCMEYGHLQQLSRLSIRGLIVEFMAPELIPAASEVKFPILVLRGFREREESTDVGKILTRYHHKVVILNARGKISSADMRPEVFIPASDETQPEPETQSMQLEPGLQVRIINGPFHGENATFEGFHGETIRVNNLSVNAGKVRFADGEVRIVPLVNLVAIPTRD